MYKDVFQIYIISDTIFNGFQ